MLVRLISSIIKIFIIFIIYEAFSEEKNVIRCLGDDIDSTTLSKVKIGDFSNAQSVNPRYGCCLEGKTVCLTFDACLTEIIDDQKQFRAFLSGKSIEIYNLLPFHSKKVYNTKIKG